jgi:predicted SAM-dependent methyltransferase
MISILKKLPFVVFLVRFVRRMFGVTTEKLDIKFHLEQRDSLIKSYLAKNDVKKLHIGCQANPIPNWLNVDIQPLEHGIVIMDATKSFYLGNETFDFVFTEHMIEHVSFVEADFMLSECFRILKSGGKIRISTPDLAFLVDLFSNPKKDIQARYIAFSSKFISNKEIPIIPSVIVNNFFRDWGHKFIHDRESLDFLLTKNGFKNVTFLKVGQSNTLDFLNIERHGNEVTEEFNLLESIVVEAEK